MFGWLFPWLRGDGPSPVEATILSAESTVVLAVLSDSVILTSPEDYVRLFGGGSPFDDTVTLEVKESTVTLLDP